MNDVWINVWTCYLRGNDKPFGVLIKYAADRGTYGASDSCRFIGDISLLEEDHVAVGHNLYDVFAQKEVRDAA